MSAAVSSHHFFIGTYTRTTSRGIYAAHLDATTGRLSTPTFAAAAANPTFLALRPDGGILYALHETRSPSGESRGAVRAFTIDPATARLDLLNEAVTDAPLCHLAVDATARALIAVSYGGGQVSAFPLAPDGTLGERSTFIRHRGPLGPNPSRQDKPHPHSVILSPDNRFVFVADLGLDRVFVYALDAAAATLLPHCPASIAVAPGAGPRHTAFSPDGRRYYILGEIDGSVTVCAYDATRGEGVPFQRISTLPAGFQISDPDRAAEIRVHPNGRFLYVSNRGHDSLAVFAIDAATGTLAIVEFTPCGGKAPRAFTLTPDGQWLVCAHQDSNTLCSFRVDTESGRLARVPGDVAVPMPVCIHFTR